MVMSSSKEPQRRGAGSAGLGALTSGYQLGLGVGALTCLLGAAVALVGLRGREGKTESPGSVTGTARPGVAAGG